MPSTSQPSAETVSAPTAADNLATLPSEKTPLFPGEDGGRSLAEMALSDLDAALQLLADRAQYITGSSGAAIALRRGEQTDMLCRASAGSNAPELGALLSMEHGLSGESVRTGRVLLCDDAERDPRVNRDACRQLGIASVVVMPIFSEGRLLGVFELFSGMPHAFGERDLAALQRLCEMVETAVKHAAAAQPTRQIPEFVLKPGQPAEGCVVIAADQPRPSAPVVDLGLTSMPLSKTPPIQEGLQKEEKVQASPKPLLWSAAAQSQGGHIETEGKEVSEPDSVPAVLKKLPKCQACGFPVSSGRMFCVECEQKQWREPRSSGTVLGDRQEAQAETALESRALREALAGIGKAKNQAAVSEGVVAVAKSAGVPPVSVRDVAGNPPRKVISSKDPAPFSGSAAPSESWFAAHKYMLGALLIVAIAIGALALLR
jgi:hypothetical protein